MNTMQNNIQLIGRLGADPELITLSSGTSLVKMRIATTEIYKDQNGEYQKRTQWHPVIAWGKRAERIGERLRKGFKVVILGKLVHRSYETKEGAKRYVSEVVLKEYSLLESTRQREAKMA